ncbi:transcriptional regulator [Salinigranum rubrum]|uniref:Transcriptional regulator n=1 Tax=Salinigranum rubrum TaxID=755307 RepID=A0A2I8VKT4_9EURY|nr:helix-turn-helix transcriptional regulator [Salinigranum rubrum]AUV82540.1 transcriptional regulator [Salinigranum rubrum]
MTTSNDEHGPPPADFSEDFGEQLRDAPADERVYRVALELTTPTRVAAVADRADCSKNAARRHLRRLADIGVLNQVMANPEAFERNESYFEWRRLDRLSRLDEDEYRDRLGELLSADETYKEKYGVEKPSDIDALEYSEFGDPEQVWLDLNNWTAIRREVRELRRSRQDEPLDEGVV